MPKPYPPAFRNDVVDVARSCRPGVTIKQIAADFGSEEWCPSNSMHRADVEDGNRPGTPAAQSSANRELKERIRPLGQENEILRRAAASLYPGETNRDRLYALMSELAVADQIPVTVTCRVLKFARPPYCRRLAQPITDAQLKPAYRRK